jgi:putative acetyltransferase
VARAAERQALGRQRRKPTLIEIREEEPGDIAAIRDLNRRAFEQDQEGNIVDALRANGAVLLSLVATLNGRVVGHIMYSPNIVASVTGAALGPMAVLPEHPRHGIGSSLVEAGSQRLRHAGCPFIVVIGHSTFYPRFGFRPASTYGITCEWEVPDDVFMALVLDDAKMQGVARLATYRAEFSSVS